MARGEPKPKKILVVCQHFWPEAFRINDICEYLVDQGCDVEVLCGLPNYPTGKFFDGYGYFKQGRQQYNNIKIRRVFEIPRGNNSNFRIFLNYISFPLASLTHIPRLLTKKYDKVFVFTYSPIMMAIAGIIVGKLKRTEITLYALDLWPENLFSVIHVRNRLLRIVATKVSHWHYRQADKILASSEKMKRHLLKVTGLPANKILPLPQACEKIYEKDIYDKELAKRFKEGFKAVFTGNISPAQSFETVIAAAKQLKAEGIKDIKWIIVGDGMSRVWLEAEVKKAGLKDDFFFEGQKPVEDIPRYTTIADVLFGGLSTSDLLEATIPAKVTSYLAAGRPIVMAIDGEARELINEKARCGFAGPTEDPRTLAENIKKVYELSFVERKAMGLRGRRYHFEHLERNLVLGKLYRFIFEQPALKTN